MLGHGDPADELLEGDDFFSVEQVIQQLAGAAGGGAGDFLLLGGGRIADLDEEHEPVELRFRQRVGAFLFDRVLRREDEKRRLQRVGGTEDGDLVLLHRLEHGGLGFRRGAVDFVGKHDVRKHRALDEFKLSPPADAGFLDDVGAGDIGRHQVGCELDAIEGKVESLGDGGNQERFRQTRHAHQQGMSAGEEADRELLDDLLLADDRLAKFRAEGLVGFSEFIDGGDIIGRKRLAEVGQGIHGCEVCPAKLKGVLGLSRRDLGLVNPVPWSRWKISISRLPAPGTLLNHPPRGVAGAIWTPSRGHAKSRTSWHVS